MDRDDRAEAIVLAAEHHLQFLAFDFGARRVERGFGLARGLGVVGALLLGHREKEPRLVEAARSRSKPRELFLDAVLLLEHGLRGLGPIPEVGLAGFFEQFFVAGV